MAHLTITKVEPQTKVTKSKDRSAQWLLFSFNIYDFLSVNLSRQQLLLHEKQKVGETGGQVHCFLSDTLKGRCVKYATAFSDLGQKTRL